MYKIRSEETELKKLFSNVFQLAPIDDFYRAQPQHYGGAFNAKRLFGGQAIAQAYLVGASLRPGMTPLRMDITFLAAGSTSHDVDYVPVHNAFDGHLVVLEGRQRGKLLNRTRIRLGNAKYFGSETLKSVKSIDVTSVKRPADCPDIDYAISTRLIDDWLQKHGFRRHYDGLQSRMKMFEVRPVRHYDFSGENQRTKCSFLMWLRLSEGARDSSIPDKMAVALMASDYLNGLPANVILDAAPGGFVPNMSSLVHTVILHSTQFDATDFFLFEQIVDSASDLMNVSGTMFSRCGTPILTVSQQAVFRDLARVQQTNAKAKM